MNTSAEKCTALIIGAGPAGLMAAEALNIHGIRPTIIEAKPTVGRKFLMAGKSGLNLTKDEPLDEFIAKYGTAAEWLRPMLSAFGPQDVQQWAEELGQPIFTGSSGRVFPKTMKASPLLRAWLGRLDVEIRTGWRWAGWGADGTTIIETDDGRNRISATATILALGGASWARLGSDGKWAEWLGEDVAAFKPSNMGFRRTWSTHMVQHFGAPIKTVGVRAGDQTLKGEFVISKTGVEGSAIYALSSQLRAGADLVLDLLPDLSEAEIARRLARPRGKASMSNFLRKTLKLTGVKYALLREFGPLPELSKLPAYIKALPVPLDGPVDIDEAISTAGGVKASALTDGLMLRKKPSIFCAGEMLDWEAPTGGYLLNGCLATGRWAGFAAAKYVNDLG